MRRLTDTFFKYIRNYYVLCRMPNGDILFCDINETRLPYNDVIEIGTNKQVAIGFAWSKGKKLFGLELQRKENSFLPSLIHNVFYQQKTLDFIDYIIKDKFVGYIPLRDIKEEIPGLYGEGYNRIVSEVIQ